MQSSAFLSSRFRRRAVLAGGALLFACAAALPALAAPQIDRPAPAFALADANGTMRRLADLRGKVVVLEWTNADCPFTIKHYTSGNMQSLQKQAAGEDVVWLSVISSAPGQQGHVNAAEANRLSASRGATPAGVLLDPKGDLGRLYGAVTTPHMFVIDREGVLRYMGGIDSIASTSVSDVPKAKPLFRDAMQAVVQGRPVATPVTRPYGCSVKYAS
ncbi:redoxin domain-containing protein [Oleispirillum naphthae]|uniref:redoxin domain-containing protein n=1 Tax=Oleispirillum naphthae TaxID=2838853 RepID=UPI00308250B1